VKKITITLTNPLGPVTTKVAEIRAERKVAAEHRKDVRAGLRAKKEFELKALAQMGHARREAERIAEEARKAAEAEAKLVEIVNSTVVMGEPVHA